MTATFLWLHQNPYFGFVVLEKLSCSTNISMEYMSNPQVMKLEA